MQEILSLFELLWMLVSDPRIGMLFALVIVAAISDYRSYRIPNWLTFGGTAVALAYALAVPFVPGQGFLWALVGMAIGLFLMLPFYMLRAMGAGDVKLMAMIGAFVGGDHIIPIILLSFIVGGTMAIGFAVYKRVLWRMLGNVKSMTQMLILSAMTGAASSTSVDAGTSGGKLPYGVSIAIGTIGYLVARQLGYL